MKNLDEFMYILIDTLDTETLLKIAIQMQKKNEKKVNELLEKVKELK